MVRTLTAIQGEYGLPSNAQSDMFSSSEESVYKSIEKALAQQNSQSIEQMAGRGMGRSSFTEGLLQQKQADVMNNMFSQFAQARTGYTQAMDLQKLSNQGKIDAAIAEAQLKRGYANEDMTRNMLMGGLTTLGSGLKGEGKSSTGSGLGTAVGSVFGGPVGGAIGGLLGGLFG